MTIGTREQMMHYRDIFIKTSDGRNIGYDGGDNRWYKGRAKFDTLFLDEIVERNEKWLKLQGYPPIPEELRKLL